MGLTMDFNPPSPPSTNPTNTARLASWIMRQSDQTKIDVSYNDTTHFGENGAFPPRSIYLFTPIILRIESHNASNAHLLPGIRRPHFDIHPLVAKTLSELRAMLVEHIPNLNNRNTTLSMDNHTNIASNAPLEMELQSHIPSTNTNNAEIYLNWWKAQFVYGRVGVVVVKVLDRSPVRV